MIMPSMSMCGLFCRSSRSLKVPGSDSSALQTRYLSIAPLGRNEIFLPIAKPAPPPAEGQDLELVQHLAGRHRQRLAQRPVAAAARIDVEGVQAGLVDVLEED